MDMSSELKLDKLDTYNKPQQSISLKIALNLDTITSQQVYYFHIFLNFQMLSLDVGF